MSQVRGFEGRTWQLALGVSVGLHLAVLTVLRFTEWPQRPPSEAIVPLEVWLSDWRPESPPEPLEPEQEIALSANRQLPKEKNDKDYSKHMSDLIKIQITSFDLKDMD